MKLLWIYVLISSVIGGALAQAIDDDDDLSNVITLPPALEKKINEPEIENVKNMLKDAFIKKCEANNHTSESVEAATTTFGICIKSKMNFENLQAEIDAAKPNGTVDEVFKKYCNKRDEYLQCFRNASDSAKPCFNASEQNNINILHNITSNLADFICYKDGDRIAMFISEGGKECFESKQVELQNCANGTFDGKSQDDLKNSTFSFINSAILEFGEEQCDKIDTFAKCVVQTLSECDAPTTSNIVESLFKFIRKGTPCKDIPEKTKMASLSDSSSFASLSTATLVTAVAALIIV